jgi:hypothetical protein
VIAWLLGDVFNILGAVLQGVLPTMIILAVYYAIADVVLLSQCLYYSGLLWKKHSKRPDDANGTTPADERTRLLQESLRRPRRGSDWSTLSPAVPFVPDTPARPIFPNSTVQTLLWNGLAIVMVCTAGILGWLVSRGDGKPGTPITDEDDVLVFNFWGQVFGYLCAALYIFSRLPQLILNFRRKSTDGLSMLFFMFASLGNITYVLSIMAYEPRCTGENGACAPGEYASIYGRYILVNLSWVLGSFVTLLLDFGVFAQYFMYSAEGPQEDILSEYSEGTEDESPWDRPLLARGNSTYG